MFDSVKKKFAFLKWLDPFTYVDLFVMPKLNPMDNKTRAWIIYIIFAALFAFLIYNGVGLLLGTQYPFMIVVSGSMEPLYHRGDIIVLQGVSSAELTASNVPVVELNAFSLKNVSPFEFVSFYCSGKNVTGLMPCDYFKLAFLNKQFSLQDFDTKELHFINGKTMQLSEYGPIVVYYSSEQHRQIVHRVIALIKAQDGLYVLTKGDSANNPLVDQDAGITAFAKHAGELQGKAIFMIPLLGYVKLILIDDPMQLLLGCSYEEGCTFP